MKLEEQQIPRYYTTTQNIGATIGQYKDLSFGNAMCTILVWELYNR